ncbi:isopenicillin N synthase family dioxygenase [Acidisoma silvae]|uniref:Isopenicillin N synthase family oxygenase n=1 Tax=Acidisoma silvae TaxID=2802396 RepID=A0A963YTI0_9PROT|nr:2-oxoglutarate and iron-dependent oxygenase domain-containing protein [Acidisoma silvae]MCB8876098.1 isopenicillin N synthase family oxygenase [Acidisoma silvae]
MTDIPIIDLSGLRSSDLDERRAVAAVLGAACRQVGFFYVCNHGIADDVAKGIFAAAYTLFAQPDAVKETLSIKRSPHNRGYVGMAGERLDAKASPDQKEAFNIGFELPADDPEVLAGKPFRGINLWPDIPGWRDQVLAYYDACMTLQLTIHRGFALDLGIAEDFFADKMDRPIATLRLLHYPAGEAQEGAEIGAGQHTDYGNVTILATDGVAGLQVQRRDGVWLDAPHIDGTFVCNIGDCLMRWTNDVYVSTPHRVLRPKAERYSVAFFADANPDAVVETLPTCLAPGEAPRYPAITCADYLRQRLTATYDHLKTGS